MPKTIIKWMLVACIFFWQPLYAQGDALKVGIVGYNPPFAVQGATGEIFGYDVDMMNYLCKAMNKTCEFVVLKKTKLFPQLIDSKIDLAVDFTITTNRLKQVDFTIPYLVSNLRFVTNTTTKLDKPFDLDELDGKKIGILEGSLFTDPRYEMRIKNASYKEYTSFPNLLEDLRNQKINFALIHDPVANYWVANSQGAFTTTGTPYQMGYGIAIAVRKGNADLLQALNQALLKYQNSPEYKANYDKYLMQF